MDINTIEIVLYFFVVECVFAILSTPCWISNSNFNQIDIKIWNMQWYLFVFSGTVGALQRKRILYTEFPPHDHPASGFLLLVDLVLAKREFHVGVESRSGWYGLKIRARRARLIHLIPAQERVAAVKEKVLLPAVSVDVDEGKNRMIQPLLHVLHQFLEKLRECKVSYWKGQCRLTLA